jgi:hypothetical protein
MINSSIKKINSNKKIKNDNLNENSTKLLNYNTKKKYIIQKGGSCSCLDMFRALNEINQELCLYILKTNGCCYKCQDSDGNTVLHLLVPYYINNKNFTQGINLLLSTDCSDFINIPDHPLFPALDICDRGSVITLVNNY